MAEDNLATELLHTLKSSIKRLYMTCDLDEKEILKKTSWNTSKYNTAKYHLMYKGDLCLPYFLYKFSKNTCIFRFYVLQYKHNK